jgi:primosomal protein N'
VGAYTIPATISAAHGEGVNLKTDASLSGNQVATITVSGREDPTAAEVKKAQIVLMILQGKDLNPWVYQIYLSPGEDFKWPAEWSKNIPPPIKFKPESIPCPLNPSQIKAINQMLDHADESRVTIIQGPPGTGKTTVIASYVKTAVAAGQTGIWLIAHSNIAVKNIAEKLADFGLSNWKLLVSTEFYEFW